MEKLEEINTLFPDLRFGQIIQSSADLYKLKKNVDLHDLNSKNLLLALEKYFIKTKKDRNIQ